MMQPHMAVAQNHSTAERHGGEGGVAKNTNPVPVTVHPQTRGLAAAKTMATFHTAEGFVAAINAASQAGQGEMLGTHATPLRRRGWGGAGRQVTECNEKTNKAQ